LEVQDWEAGLIVVFGSGLGGGGLGSCAFAADVVFRLVGSEEVSRLGAFDGDMVGYLCQAVVVGGKKSAQVGIELDFL
jgi:hypothetical protein